MGAIIVIGLIIFVYAMCRISSRDDREREQMARKWGEK